MFVPLVHSARSKLARLAAPLLALAAWGCAPERVDMNVHDIFTGDAARYALQTQMPASTLASVGGFLPAGAWPASATPLLLDVKVVAENKIDLAGSNIDISGYNALRLHWATLSATGLAGGALTPRPTSVDVYVGPATATAITDPGVLALGSGAFPEVLALSTDAGPAFDAGPGPGDPIDAGQPIDAGSPIDAGPPADAGTDAGSPVDAGSGADAGPASSSDAGPGQTLVFSSDAQLILQKLVFAGQPFSLFVVLHLPVDTAANPILPSGGADLSFDIQFEMAR